MSDNSFNSNFGPSTPGAINLISGETNGLVQAKATNYPSANAVAFELNTSIGRSRLYQRFERWYTWQWRERNLTRLLPRPLTTGLAFRPDLRGSILETTTRTRTTPLAVPNNRPLAVNTNMSSTAFWDRIQNNRDLAIQLAIGIVAVVGLVAIIAGVWSYRSNVANAALAQAMQTFDTPVSTPDQPVPASVKSFPSVEVRAKAANAQFGDVANHYGMTAAGRNAQYLQGVTAMQSGDNAAAERLLKNSAGDWNHDVATLAQLSLAGLYHATNRDALAVETYQKITNKPSTLVPAGLAQLQLASLYESEGKSADAKKLYAQIKDKNPKSAAAEIATQKLTGAPTE